MGYRSQAQLNVCSHYQLTFISILQMTLCVWPRTDQGTDCEQPPAKAGGFGLRLKAGLIGHSADLHLNSVLFLNYSAQLAFFPQPFKPTQLCIDNT